MTSNTNPTAPASVSPTKAPPNVDIYCDRTFLKAQWGIGVVLKSGAHLKTVSERIEAEHAYQADVLAATAGLKLLKQPCHVTVYMSSPFLPQVMTGVRPRNDDSEQWRDLDFYAMPHEVEWKTTNIAVGNLQASHALALAWRAVRDEKAEREGSDDE